MLEAIKRIFKRRSEEDIEDIVRDSEEVEELVEKAKRVERERLESSWDEFKALCKEYGVDYREVVSKAAWMYIEETGGLEDDPITKAKEVANLLKELNEAIDMATEPESLKKVRMYKDSIKHVAELKNALHELKSEKISATDILAIMKKMGVL